MILILLNRNEEKTKKLQTFDLSYFLDKTFFFGDDAFKNMFICQPTFNTLELKDDKGTEYIIA